MRRTVFLASARADLVDILVHVTEASGSLSAGRALVAALRMQCPRLAALPQTLGRPRPDLRADIRSFPFRNRVIHLRLRGDMFEVVNVLHSRRDLPGRLALPGDG